MKKLKIVIVIFILVFGLGLILKNQILDFYSEFTLKLPEVKKEMTKVIESETRKEIFTPPPLKAKKEYPQSLLTREGIIEWTNLQRKKYGLLPLKESAQLNTSAAVKVEDMFQKQYFAHLSPTGEGVADLAKIVNYEFILIGENLALGNFKDDKDLVLGWMESPGHRENILNSRYQEIGVAVKKDVFEGKMVWLAVQHFGLPLSACPQPDESLLAQIETNENELAKLQKKLEKLQFEIKKTRPKRGVAFLQKIKEYNLLVEQYNLLLKETEILIEDYNNQVNLFNECASGVK
jgi:uncharacterized protein YkwD